MLLGQNKQNIVKKLDIFNFENFYCDHLNLLKNGREVFDFFLKDYFHSKEDILWALYGFFGQNVSHLMYHKINNAI